MGKLKRIYQNVENGGYCIEEVAKMFSNVYMFCETSYVYDVDTKYAYKMPTDSSEPVPLLNKEGKQYRFDSNRMV